MIITMNYYVVNGDKSQPFTLEKELQNAKELEELRKELEEKHHCFEVIKQIGKPDEIRRIKEIHINYKSCVTC